MEHSPRNFGTALPLATPAASPRDRWRYCACLIPRAVRGKREYQRINAQDSRSVAPPSAPTLPTRFRPRCRGTRSTLNCGRRMNLLVHTYRSPVAAAMGDIIGAGDVSLTVWNIARWPLILALMVLAVAALYYATPNVQQPEFRWISVGAGVAIVTWVVASVLFGLYVANFASYNKTYGALAGVIVFLLWLWITNLALLFGAELDAELERGRQLQAGRRSPPRTMS
jgi:hypothetical protein